MKSEKFICLECETTFSSEFEVRDHRNIHTGERPFKCGICGELFPTVSGYACHALEKHFAVERINTSVPVSTEFAELESFSHKYLYGNEIPFIDKHETVTRQTQAIPSFAAHNDSTVEEEEPQNMGNSGNDNHDRNVNQTDLTGNKKTYVCGQCNVKFKSAKKFIDHKKSHIFVCENCNNRYSSSEKLAKHVCFVSSDGEAFQCSCSLPFTKAAQFKLHVGNRPYSCCKCCMQFNRITNLVRHIRTHTKQKPYVCNQCGRGFSQSTNLKNHASVHLGVKAIQCDVCDFSCKTLGGLVKHKKKHKDGCITHVHYVDKRKTSTEAISCPICKKEFPFKRNVGMHMKVHRRKESLCQECGKVFDTKSKLTSHYKACHGVPSICQTCGKTFASSVLLAAHEKIHVQGKKYSCTKCCKMFSIKNYLVQHMKTHLEGKQYSCSKCGKLFKVSVSLKYHSKICESLNVL